jgi:hypothetical protein
MIFFDKLTLGLGNKNNGYPISVTSTKTKYKPVYAQTSFGIVNTKCVCHFGGIKNR